ncbi:MAG: NTPase-like protein, partial [Gammaproteobacteria bacterium]|nr:NTPase-like protein [Gammaproteobacteria bacterium]
MNDHRPGSVSFDGAGASEPTHAATATPSVSASGEPAPAPDLPASGTQLWPVFICYRQVDGLAAARRLHELIDKRNITGPKGEVIELDVYLDQTMPAVADWREIHRPYLEKARALIVICTPGSKIIEGPDDWVHTEINWWLGHRNAVPILIDPLGQGVRYVPTAIRERWPETQRIRLVEAEWRQLPPAELEQKAIELRRQIIGNILPSGAVIYEEELKAERKRGRQLARALAGAIALLAVAGAATWYAFTKRTEAERSQAEAETSRAAARASAQVATSERDKALTGQSQFLADLARQQRDGGDAGTAILLALEALPEATGPDRPYVPEAEFALNTALHSLRERRLYMVDGDLVTAALSPNGKRILTTSNNQARLRNAESGEGIGEPLKTNVSRATFSPDGSRIIVAAADDGTAWLLDSETGKPAGESLSIDSNTKDRNLFGYIWHTDFSHDGKRIVTAYNGGVAQLWDAATRKQIGQPLRGHTPQSAYIATFSYDDKRVATASWQDVIVWDLATGKPSNRSREIRNSLAFSPNLEAVIATSTDGIPNVFELATGQPIGEPLAGHKATVRSARFSPDGKRIITGSSDRTMRLWDTITHKQVGEPLKGHSDAVLEAAFS